MNLFGINTIPVATTSAVQAGAQGDGHLCILALNETQSDAFHIQGNNVAKAENCWVWVNSSSTSAMSAVGGSKATAMGFCTHGNVDGEEHFVPSAGVKCSEMPDPIEQKLRSYNFVDDECDFEDYTLKRGTHTLYPGVYCGDTVFKPHAHVTFKADASNNPYIIKNGELLVQAQSSLKGDAKGVTIAFTGSDTKFTVRGGADVDLRAPSEGELPGFLLIDQKSDGSSSEIQDTIIRGGGSLKFEGLVYAPQWRIIISGNSDVNGSSKCFAMVADRFRMEGNGELTVIADCEESGLAQLMPKVKSVAKILY